MTKKKIRYSEFPSADQPAPEAQPPAARAGAKRARKEAVPPAAPVDEAPAVAPGPRTPVDLARAVAAARAAEAGSEAWAPTPAVSHPAIPAAPAPPLPRATVTMSLSRLTPAHGTPVIGGKASRHTPAGGSAAIAAHGIRLTPIHGSGVIPAAPIGPVDEASLSLRERIRLRSGTLELLVFRLANELFGIELAAVEEAIDLPPLRHVPEMPPAMLGVITVRGSLTPTYSPEGALGLALASRASALIFKRGRGRVALVVDDVDDVCTLDLSQLRDAPGGDAGDGILLGVVRRTDALLGLVDAEALIAACQAVPVLETA
jgi:purine-binding chemotaxis protein CheW